MKKLLLMLKKCIFKSPLSLFQLKFIGFLIFLSLINLNLQAQTVSPNIKLDQFGYPVNARKIAVISNPIIGYNNTQIFTPGSIYQIKKVTIQ